MRYLSGAELNSMELTVKNVKMIYFITKEIVTKDAIHVMVFASMFHWLISWCNAKAVSTGILVLYAVIVTVDSNSMKDSAYLFVVAVLANV